MKVLNAYTTKNNLTDHCIREIETAEEASNGRKSRSDKCTILNTY